MYTVKEANKIFGEINLSGSKNAALPIIIAACLSEEKVILHNVPLQLNDVKILIELLKGIGFNIKEYNEENKLEFKNDDIKINNDVSNRAKEIRYSLLLLSLMLNRTGKIKLPLPGGDQIGLRKHDIHINSLTKMGANINENQSHFIGALKGNFKGQDLNFHTATTSGTENVIIAAVLADGKTIIRNANTRPEIVDLINFLNILGANIIFKTRYIEIQGVSRIKGGEYRIMNGRDEALTYIILAGMKKGEVKIINFRMDSIKADVSLLKEIGLDIFEWGNNVYASAKNRELMPFSMATSPYPGIESDMQPLYAALASTIEGESIITDMRFTERFQYVKEFKKFGIDINNYSNSAIIQGGKELKGAYVKATDLRCGVSLILLGCVAKGETKIKNSYQINRGYVNIASKLNKLGCQVGINKEEINLY